MNNEKRGKRKKGGTESSTTRLDPDFFGPGRLLDVLKEVDDGSKITNILILRTPKEHPHNHAGVLFKNQRAEITSLDQGMLPIRRHKAVFIGRYEDFLAVFHALDDMDSVQVTVIAYGEARGLPKLG